jgi:hypothetical protein
METVQLGCLSIVYRYILSLSPIPELEATERLAGELLGSVSLVYRDLRVVSSPSPVLETTERLVRGNS